VRLVMSQNRHLLVSLRLDHIPTMFFVCLFFTILILSLLYFLLQSPMRPETVDEDPNEHGRLPNINIQLPLMQDLMANKI
jgi:hypothetical protein